MTSPLALQAGGTLNPNRHLYIERPQDERLFQLLSSGHYVNVLTSRQMGKSSIMMRTALRLKEQGVKFSTIDLSGEMGTPSDIREFYLGLMQRIARDLDIRADLSGWLSKDSAQTWNQKLLSFFRDLVCEEIDGQVIIFLDEIDSTLKLPFTDDLFTAMRAMYNERTLVEPYQRISFCLLGVASANELIKDRRTTPYNVGETVLLQDFDSEHDDLSALKPILDSDSENATGLLDRILYWTSGHPYLTARLALDLSESGIRTRADTDTFVETTFFSQNRSRDPHFDQILRFVEQRMSSGASALALYRRLLRNKRVEDKPSAAHNELKLSGLVKRGSDGNLVVRNRIYRRLFDRAWAKAVTPAQPDKIYRFVTIGALLFAALTVLLAVGRGIQIPAEVTAMTLSADDGTLVVGHYDRKVIVWDVGSGAQLTWFELGSSVDRVDVSADGHRVLAASVSGVELWEVGQRASQIAHVEADAIFSSSDRSRFLAIAADGTAHILDLDAGHLSIVDFGNAGEIINATFSSNNARLATSFAEGQTLVTAVTTGDIVRTVLPDDPATVVAFAGDDRLITASLERLQAWDLATGELTFRVEGEFATQPLVSANGRVALLATPDGEAAVIALDTGSDVDRFTLEAAVGQREFELSPNGEYLAVTHDNNATLRYLASDRKPLDLGYVPATRRAQFSPTGRYVLGAATFADLFDVEAGTNRLPYGAINPPVDDYVDSTVFAASGNHLVAANRYYVGLTSLESLAMTQTFPNGIIYRLKAISDASNRWQDFTGYLMIALIFVLDFFGLRDIVQSGYGATGKSLWIMGVILVPLLGLLCWVWIGKRYITHATA